MEVIGNLNLDEVDPYLDLEQSNELFCITENYTSVYEPNMVSIGPIHHGKTHLKRMQIHKKRALMHFLKRSGKPIWFYKGKLKVVLDELRQSYAHHPLKEEWKDDDNFVALMILDGVFLLEFLSVLRGSQRSHDYSSIDPVFGHQGHISIYDSVMRDLLLFEENQLPYLALQTLLSAYLGAGEEAVRNILHWLMFAPKNEPEGLNLFDMNRKRLLESEFPKCHTDSCRKFLYGFGHARISPSKTRTL